MSPADPIGRDPGPMDPEDGRIMLLTSAFVAFALMLIAVVASASAVHLDRKALYDVADLAAADAASAMSPGSFYAGAGAPADGAPLTLSDADVRAAVEQYLAEHPPALPVAVTAASSPDGHSARVTLAGKSRPPLLRWFTDAFGGGIAVSASSTARAW
ncbi:hypothetical protein [Promicromonospora panici]|uniref:hypothetical protein n=1 Tax=Promicromonospora panici TaxID=2219658 RepID=UPI00101E139E|nr:hypothetical protein [Promicromonospora panici]